MHRSLTSVGLAALLAILLFAAAPIAGQAPAPAAKANGTAAKAYVQTKTPDGQPDLQGYWTVSTYVPFERPQNVTKEFYTPAEMAKIEQDEAVVEAAVIPLPDPNLGAVPVVYTVLRPGTSCTERELQAFCARRLSKHKVPRAVHFVDELRKTTTGKIQKFRLKEAHQ